MLVTIKLANNEDAQAIVDALNRLYKDAYTEGEMPRVDEVAELYGNVADQISEQL